VIEFFWYGCPHCYALEPDVVAVVEEGAEGRRVQARARDPSDAWLEAAKIYYTLEAMGMLDEFHQKVFDADPQSNHRQPHNKKIRDEWLAEERHRPRRLREAEKSFSVATNVNRAKTLTYAYKVDSVPRIASTGSTTRRRRRRAT
jgi:thiol:disulfide interchange protein DsbA